MRAYIFVMEHPFFAVTDEAGQFEIKDLPDDAYTLAICMKPLVNGKRKSLWAKTASKALRSLTSPRENRDLTPNGTDL
ncbi:MAG: hypothetical protein OSB39_04215 [Opitutales bacterium]|nr:hypothetical protein [Opitutales bacterium]